MSFDFIEVFAIICALQLLLLSLLLVLYKKSRPASNKILAAFLFFNALSIIEFLLYRFKDFIGPRLPHVFFIGSLFVALWGPSLYFYTKSLLTRDFHFQKKDLLHVLPFFALVVYTVFDFHLRSTVYKRQLLAAEYQMSYGEKIIIFSAVHIQILTYLFFSFLMLRRFKKESQSFYSSLERIRLSWLRFVLIGFIAFWSVDIVYLALWRTRFAYLSSALDVISFTLTIVFVNLIVYKSLNTPEVLSGIDERKAGPNDKKPLLSRLEKGISLETLTSHMEAHKPYLKPELNILELSEEIGIPSRQLSQLVNESLNMNFFDFINSYRVGEFKKLMQEPAARQKTILQILFEVGFNSKASFNRAFKKHTGMTPSQYKKNIRPEA